MRLFRLIRVLRYRDGTYSERGPVARVRAKHARQARRILADELPAPKGLPSPWLHSRLSRCTPVPHARCAGMRAGLVTR